MGALPADVVRAGHVDEGVVDAHLLGQGAPKAKERTAKYPVEPYGLDENPRLFRAFRGNYPVSVWSPFLSDYRRPQMSSVDQIWIKN